MHDDSSAIHFGCTNCGKCCSFKPTESLGIALEEMLRLSDQMLFESHLITYPVAREELIRQLSSPGKGPASLRALEAIIAEEWEAVPFSGALMSMKLEITMVPRPDGNCWALADKRCALYAERPLRCRTFPLPVDIPPALMSRSGLPVGNSLECDFSANAPVIAESGAVQGEWAEAFQALPGMRRTMKKLLRFMLKDEELRAPIILPAVANAWHGDTSVRFDLHPVLLAALQLGQVSDHQVIRVLVGQHGMIRRWIGAAAAEHRAYAERLIRYANNYQAMLSGS
jgi:Fe-S-cluster containining protein